MARLEGLGDGAGGRWKEGVELGLEHVMGFQLSEALV